MWAADYFKYDVDYFNSHSGCPSSSWYIVCSTEVSLASYFYIHSDMSSKAKEPKPVELIRSREFARLGATNPLEINLELDRR